MSAKAPMEHRATVAGSRQITSATRCSARESFSRAASTSAITAATRVGLTERRTHIIFLSCLVYITKAQHPKSASQLVASVTVGQVRVSTVANNANALAQKYALPYRLRSVLVATSLRRRNALFACAPAAARFAVANAASNKGPLFSSTRTALLVYSAALIAVPQFRFARIPLGFAREEFLPLCFPDVAIPQCYCLNRFGAMRPGRAQENPIEFQF
jgi:hypothetical protein